jgi:hypothetical protein
MTVALGAAVIGLHQLEARRHLGIALERPLGGVGVGVRA